jgi:hypothetical protein
VQEETGLVYVSSGMGIEIFDPTTQTFSHYSRDRDMRVGSLAFANDGSLWAVTWPDRHQVVRVGDPLEPDSVLNPDVYSLTGLVSGEPSIRSIVYDAATRTAILTLNALAEDIYRFEIDAALSSALGQPLGTDHVVEFRTVSDLSVQTQIAFSGTRMDRADGTVSYEVSVTSTGDSALVLPLLLVLDPPEGFQGVPLGATGQTADGEWLIALDGGPSSSVRLQPGETPVCFAPERRGGLQWAPQKRPARD